MSNLIDIQSQIEKLQKQASEIKAKEFSSTVQEILAKMQAFGITVKDLQTAKDYVLAMIALPVNISLVIVAGKRQLTLKAIDIGHYTGNRANRGLYLPKGFQRVDGLQVG